MIQTLDDILSDQPTSLGRFIVWLRISFELPINVIEENVHSIGGISVSKLPKISNRQLIYTAFAILLIGSYAAIGVIWKHQRNQVILLNDQMRTVTENQFAMSGGAYNAITIIPSENAVYMPLARLKLPATDLNQRLVYTYPPAHKLADTDQLPPQLSISTHDLSVNNFSTTEQFDCSQVVYADFITPSYPVSPTWKSDGSVKLSDGRTMNIYYAPSIPGCENSWRNNNIDAKAIADSLKQAVSY